MAGATPPQGKDLQSNRTPSNTAAKPKSQRRIVEPEPPFSWARWFVKLNGGVWYGDADCGAVNCPVCGADTGADNTLAVRDGTNGRINLVCILSDCPYFEILQEFALRFIPTGFPFPRGQVPDEADECAGRVMTAQTRGWSMYRGPDDL